MSDERIRREMGDVARACLARYLAIRTSRRPPRDTSSFTVTEEEAELAAKPAAFSPAEDFPLESERISAAVTALDEALAATPEPRLARLQRVCQLGHLDLLIVCVLLAPELDEELERGYMYALDDFTRKRPDLRFVARMIGGTDDATLDRVLTRFDDAAPLRRHGVVSVSASDGPSQLRSVRLADRIVAFFRGHDAIDELARGHVRLGREALRAGDVVLPEELVRRIGRALFEAIRPPRVLLAGPDGVGRGLVVEALMAGAGREVLRVDLAGIAAEGGAIPERVAAAFREAALRDAAVILDGGALVSFLGSLGTDRGNTEATVAKVADPRVQLGVILRMTFAAALSIPFWHAPALVHWGGHGWAKSLFFSSVGVWRNKGAFTVYGIAWLAVWMLLVPIASIAVGILGPQSFPLVATPLTLAYMTLFCASFWFTFADCFTSDDAAPPRDTVGSTDSLTR